jgi:hypothetical protein
MKYELGDRVKISKHWKKVDQYECLKQLSIDDLENHLRSEEMQGDSVEIDRLQKFPIEEVGLIVGVREIKVRYGLTHCWEDSFDTGVGMMPEVDEIRLDNHLDKFEKIYLVATRMNCLIRVSFEDIKYIGGSL